MTIWSKSVWVRRGGLAGEEGGLCRRVGGYGEGVVDLRLVRDGVFIVGSRVLGEWLGVRSALGVQPP